MKIGIGFDAHRFAQGRRLVIGGGEIPHPQGLEGHSDADVLLHSICDALLGALALGDIGMHFPDTDPRYKGIASTALLEQVRRLVEKRGYRVGNVDATIIAEAPRMAPHIEAMRECVAKILGCAASDVGIKATTTEGMGFCGRGEGIAAMAVACVEKVEG
ncbi:MAG: 2-C-methyl-D-erythritol 2,4-cyclodiphosphate synthase [Candidatus Aureabacteria bacterium]|nr:2-C-methyl-D-erythritol 2,4-cyclodiphosphate synthase [Candidatus Auribacterota bacterium]